DELPSRVNHLARQVKDLTWTDKDPQADCSRQNHPDSTLNRQRHTLSNEPIPPQPNGPKYENRRKERTPNPFTEFSHRIFNNAIEVSKKAIGGSGLINRDGRLIDGL